MAPAKQHSGRRGLTLVELIVVITIILMVAALAAAFMPRVQERQNVTRGADLLSQWLLTSKQRARRDNLVTGLQLQQGPGDSAGQYSQVVYVQQPPPFAGGQCVSVASGAGGWTATFAGVDFSNGGNLPANEWLVLPGDYLELNNTPVHLITGTPSPAQATLASGSPWSSPTTNYRIHRMPRVLTGEPVLQLPGTVIVDLTSTYVRPGQPVLTQVLFAPNGAIMGLAGGGSAVGMGKIAWCVRDPTSTDATLGVIVAVQTQSGFVATYDLGPAGNVFQYADLGSDEGL